MKRRFRQYNVIRTDTIEGKIGLAVGKRDYAAEEVWRRVAVLVGAPIREEEIAKHAESVRKVIQGT